MDQWAALPMVPLDDSEPVCRICHGGSSSTIGRLHKCCKCRGSIQLVHRPCLAQWLSATTGRTCELCGHDYRVVRTSNDYFMWLMQGQNLPSLRYILLVELLCMGTTLLVLHLLHDDCSALGVESCAQSPTSVALLSLVFMFFWCWYVYLLALWFVCARKWRKGAKNRLLVLDIE